MDCSETDRPCGNALDLLKSVGLRPTRQRLALARLLFEDGVNRHVTAEQLHSEALKARVKVSLATVYNTLHQFTSIGLLRELVVDSGRSYFDTNTGHHHHFFHEDSGTLEDIDGARIQITALPEPEPGRRISRVDVVIRVRGEDADRGR